MESLILARDERWRVLNTCKSWGARRGTRARLLLSALAILAGPLSAQYLREVSPDALSSEDHVVAGFDAWASARGNGFIFQPLIHEEGQWVTEPRDGVNTQLLGRLRSAQGDDQTVPLGRIAAGSASVNRPAEGSRTIAFEFFADQRLASGWTIVRVEIIGSFTWDRPVRSGSRDMSFRVSASSTPKSTGNVVVGSIVLRGPVGASWRDAFDRSAGPQ